ncbi:MAG: lipoyl synthase [Lentisphaeria bacterium]
MNEQAEEQTERKAPLPPWLRVRYTGGKERLEMRKLLERAKLHTVCESAKCPNLCDCWQRRTATFMILGNNCSRNCKFCAVEHGRPEPVDPAEPGHVAEAVNALKLRYAVITCVTRDDLPDGGAAHMAATVNAIRSRNPETKVEVLCSDYQEQHSAIDCVLAAGPVVFGHNLETVARLTPLIRSHADYQRSLRVLRYAAEQAPTGTLVKSGLMLGLGETAAEIRQALADLRAADVRMVTMGQYLQPSKDNWPVARIITPDEFKQWADIAENDFGFQKAVCGPLVRSSYLAEEAYNG